MTDLIKNQSTSTFNETKFNQQSFQSTVNQSFIRHYSQRLNKYHTTSTLHYQYTTPLARLTSVAGFLRSSIVRCIWNAPSFSPVSSLTAQHITQSEPRNTGNHKNNQLQYNRHRSVYKFTLHVSAKASDLCYYSRRTTAIRDRIIRHLRRIWSGPGVRIQMWTPDPDFFQNFTGTSSSKDTSVIKFS